MPNKTIADGSGTGAASEPAQLTGDAEILVKAPVVRFNVPKDIP